MPSPRISLTRNITNAHTLEELKTQVAEFASRLEDYLNTQVGIHFLDSNKQRPTLIAGDLYFDFTQHPEFATLQQWDGQKLIPLDLGSISGFVDLIAQGIGSGTDSSLFLRSDGAGHWVLAAGPVGPAGPAGATGATGADGESAYQIAVDNGFVGTEADWLLSLVGATGAPGAPGAPGSDGVDGSIWYNGSGVPSSGLGINGDYYVRTTNGDVYFKSSGAWAVILNIMGPAGAAGATGATGATGPSGPGILVGAGNPGSGLGTDGQLYINNLTGDIWDKESGTWMLYGANAYRIQGKVIDPTTTTAPTNGDILTYDSSLFSGVGGWKSAAGTGAATSSSCNVANNPVFF